MMAKTHRRQFHRKRRVRKKWRIAEHTQYGFEVTAKIPKSDTPRWEWFEKMIAFIESNDMQCGGSLKDGMLFSGYWYRRKRHRSLTHDDACKIVDWLAKNGASEVTVGPFVDVWG